MDSFSGNVIMESLSGESWIQDIIIAKIFVTDKYHHKIRQAG